MRWIIGDVHGMRESLETVLEAVRRADSAPCFYFTGDYVNRGPDARGVIDLLLGLPAAQFIRGNHDDILDEILHGRGYTLNASEGDSLIAFQWFMQHGLADTLASYGADRQELHFLARHRSTAAHRLPEILAAIPESHRRFIHGLPPVIEEPDLFIAHGRWDPDSPNHAPALNERLAASHKLRFALLWGRFEGDEVTQLKLWDRIGYFGHTSVDLYPRLLADGQLTPIMADKMVLLDTAAALVPEGRLTAFCHETRQFIQADREGKLLPAGSCQMR